MEFKFLVPILLVRLYLLKARPEINGQLVRRVLVLEHPAEEVNALDAPHNATLRYATD